MKLVCFLKYPTPKKSSTNPAEQTLHFHLSNLIYRRQHQKQDQSSLYFSKPFCLYLPPSGDLLGLEYSSESLDRTLYCVPQPQPLPRALNPEQQNQQCHFPC